ncbi:TIGR01244 family sulfur transferase [Neisseria perflava]|uniref:TIGR01244 family sulfur transferase n=1 Tax=Neisseria perflava TaxID=33053 RepID=UPI00209C98E8|nr:TIGR01244 family sulfur transferase [Neisseria perflava]MCP1659160.1 sulfide:quinone oxidoreductase [Neisseria perflava]MCP1771343.1 sulfide:quinone oxidoreductase [Neisseria perflava]
MAILKLTDNLYVSPQLTEADARQAATLGVQTVICNRPDDEEAGQPSAGQVARWLENTGIRHFHHQPVVAPAINAADVAAFHDLLQQTEAPVLAYCRTGTRSSLLWGYYQVQHGMSVEAVETAARQAGVDLANFTARLQQAAQGL